MNLSRSFFLAAGFLSLAACQDIFSPTPTPDYTINVSPTASGSVATPPECASWNDDLVNPSDGQALPQFGCATARNLANMVENPDDIVEGRDLANMRGVTAVGAVRRYDNNQPRGLIMPAADSSQTAVTTSPSGSSSIVGDVTGGGSSPSVGAASAP